MRTSLPITLNTNHIFATLRRERGCIAALLLLPLLITISMACHSFTESEEIIQNNCQQCHGANGNTTVESWPNLNCQNRGYLYSRLMNLKRENDHDIDDQVKNLSITEIDEISRYYSNQKCSGVSR